MNIYICIYGVNLIPKVGVTDLSIYIYIYICVWYICVYEYIHMHIHIHIDRSIDR